MYKDFGTTIVVGSTGSGKSYFMTKYINEVVTDVNNKLFLVDPKWVELTDFQEYENVTYIRETKDFVESIFNTILSDKTGAKKYLFVDEYAELKFDEAVHKKVKYLLKNRKELNLQVVLVSQRPTVFCNGMKANCDTVIKLNGRNFY